MVLIQILYLLAAASIGFYLGYIYAKSDGDGGCATKDEPRHSTKG